MTQSKAFLLIGQSNMAGRAPLTDTQPPPNPKVLRFTPSRQWEVAQDPVHKEENAGKTSEVGPAMTFAQDIAQAHPDWKIGLIPCAVGGTPLSRWEKGGDLYNNAVQQTRAVLADDYCLGAILWLQGESDAATYATAVTYQTRLQDMIRDLRNDLGAGDVPFISAEIGSFNANRSERPYWKQINDALNNLVGKVLNYECISTADLTDKGDSLHFDTPSQRTIGHRFAARFL